MFVDLVFFGIPGIATGGLAYRKNRSALAWGTLGFLSLGMALIVLAFMPFRCERCSNPLSNKQRREKTCPACEELDQEVYAFIDPIPDYIPESTRKLA
ncbi:hypothetical protein [Ideonella azotifigens]|nr:hypothetical protein [Ideonella azotifigens]